MSIDSILSLESQTGVDWNVHKRKRRYVLLISQIKAIPCGREPIHDRLINPIWLSDLLTGSVRLLVQESSAGVEEPQNQTRNFCFSMRIDRQIVVGDACVAMEDHLLGEAVGILPFSSKDVLTRKIERTVMIPVGRCPRQTTLQNWLYHLIDGCRTVGLEGVFASDKVSVKHD